MMNNKLISFIRDAYQTSDFIPLHKPTFVGNEKAYVMNTIDSTFVSSVGKYVEDFEKHIESYTGTAKAVATVNGTAALHAALYMAGVKAGDLVITQALTFVATCNALYHMGAEPIFIDVSKVSLGLCPRSVEEYLQGNAKLNAEGECVHKSTGQRIKALVPMHTFGHPVDLDELIIICLKWNLVLVEDAAESLGSFYKGKHTGVFGDFSALSFNGNKIITTGGGGMVLCKSIDAGLHTKHITTTAKEPHKWDYTHDMVGYNYRMPNLNAALGCAQMERLPSVLADKHELAEAYVSYFSTTHYQPIVELAGNRSNYWLNAILCVDLNQRDALLEAGRSKGVQLRPIWQLMPDSQPYGKALCAPIPVARDVASRLVNLPSSCRLMPDA